MSKVQEFKPYVAVNDNTRVVPQRLSHTPPKELNCIGKGLANFWLTQKYVLKKIPEAAVTLKVIFPATKLKKK